jgi:hypothetical protein
MVHPPRGLDTEHHLGCHQPHLHLRSEHEPVWELLLQRPAASIASPASPPGLGTENFTGAPHAWVSQYHLQTGNASLTLPKGTYYIFAGSSTQRVVLAATDHQRPSRVAGGFAVFTQIVPQ